MRFGSVCSGIEAASVAWESLGWKAAWFSEIEKFPSSVLAHHYPDTPNLGDMTALPDRILSGEIEAPEIFCGGTPCQAFSVAGLRQSLNDDRGNLSLTFVGIANAIDHVRSVRGDSSSIIFWENVPGVLNTKDNAFGCFIGALAGEVDPVTCPNGKWSTAGVVVGQKRAVAWRVLDAQYFGVAQRRRRVFVVASARADFDPAAVLFEFEGFRRDIAPSREARQSVAPTIAGCSNGGGSNGPGRDVDSCESLQIVRPVYEMHGQDSRVRDLGDVCSTVTSKYGTGGGNVPVTFQPIMTMAHGQAGAEIAADRTPILTCNHEAPIAFHPTQDPISIHPHCIGRAPEAGPQGKEYLPDGSAYCMDSRGQPQAVVQPIGTDIFNAAITGDVAVPLTHRSDGTGTGPTVMVQPIGPIRYGDHQQDTLHHESGIMSTLPAGSKDNMGHYTNTVHGMAVRRLTPVECERLQGFPDNYTHIKDKCPDGPRYKALGNSWAVPVVRWIGKRIQEHINAP